MAQDVHPTAPVAIWGATMSRKWGASGVGSFVPVEIDAATREHITLQLGAAAIDLTRLDHFFGALGTTIGLFHSHRELAARSKPAMVRTRISEALNVALQLNDCLNSLDGNSRQLIGEQIKDGVITLQDHHLYAIISALSQAEHAADEFPTRGRLPEYERLCLAVDIADAMEALLGIKPTSTKESQFEAILVIALEAGTGDKREGAHDLARRAIAARKFRDQPDPRPKGAV